MVNPAVWNRKQMLAVQMYFDSGELFMIAFSEKLEQESSTYITSSGFQKRKGNLAKAPYRHGTKIVYFSSVWFWFQELLCLLANMDSIIIKYIVWWYDMSSALWNKK